MNTLKLDLADIQGNVLRGYRLAAARYLFYRFDRPAAGRKFVESITDEITTSVEWEGGKPQSMLNIAFTFAGLAALAIPADALEGFPAEFRQGMAERARSLGDTGESDPSKWEPFWRDTRIHALVMVCVHDVAVLSDRIAWVEARRKEASAVTEVGHQDAAALVINGECCTMEHFGYADGIANPDIANTGFPTQPGSGKPTANGWDPVAPGEFLLGHLNEQGEIAPTPPPISLYRNGTFLVYRKLHQNVATFRRWLHDEGARIPGGKERLAAKLLGRWRDGTPLMLSPDAPNPALARDDNRAMDFRYADDPHGVRCPMGAHIRRANPRDSLGFGTVLTAGRRILRRGVPYGEWTPDDQPADDNADQGIVFMCLNASIREQYEFIAQQWMNYGNDFSQGNDPDPLVGNRIASSKMVIPGDPSAGERPHICFGMPQFVVTRGGEYFFVPSVTALRWMVRERHALKRSLTDFDSAPPRKRPTLPDKPAPMTNSLLSRLEAFGTQVVHHLEAIPHEIARGVEHELDAAKPELTHLADELKAWAPTQAPRLFAVLRRVKPILTLHDLTIVSRYEDVQEVLARDSVFAVPYADGFRELTGGRDFFLGMSNTPEYQRDSSNMRVVIRREDLPTRIAPFVAATADRLVAAAPGRLDIVGELATPAATAFVTDYFGTPSPAPRAFAQQGTAMSAYLFLSAANLKPAAIDASGKMLAALRATVAARKQSRGAHDDVLERCLTLQDAGVPGMDDETLVINLFGMVVGAIPTTVAMVARAIDELLRRPQELRLAHMAAASGDTATVTRYISEAMRFNPLGPGVPRLVMADYTIAKGTHRAHPVKAGTRVLALLQSATFDDIRIDRPNDFRIDRPDYEYMHFGYGIHTCFGQYINMVQIPRIAQAILARPNLRRAKGADGAMQLDGPFPSKLIVEFDS